MPRALYTWGSNCVGQLGLPLTVETASTPALISQKYRTWFLILVILAMLLALLATVCVNIRRFLVLRAEKNETRVMQNVSLCSFLSLSSFETK